MGLERVIVSPLAELKCMSPKRVKELDLSFAARLAAMLPL